MPQPIGTIRLVPFPHSPHPVPGSKFFFSPSDSTSSPSEAVLDRPTSFHDGKEPYIKLGRIAVIKGWRGKGVSGILARAALAWARENSTFFNPDAREGEWKGLVCVHAQAQVEGAWAKWGFESDEEMGRWEEEGIEHLGMWRRLDLAG